MRPYILITNDDGIESEGLRAAVQAALPFGDVAVAAPIRQQTAMGRAYPQEEDLGIIEPWDMGLEGVSAYAVHGSPAYCAAYGILEIARKTPDLVISGINRGLNVGKSASCSGTLGAAFEASSQGVPVLALSLEAYDIFSDSKGKEYEYASKAAAIWIERMLSDSEEDFLNVNIPSGRIDPQDFRYTFFDSENYYILRKPEKRDWSKPYALKFDINVDEKKLSEGSDIKVCCIDRIVSVTAVTMDMTKGEMRR